MFIDILTSKIDDQGIIQALEQNSAPIATNINFSDQKK